ncbi:hypothetical protein KY284_028253 [Solanum tuberosum]|nr:hypothetical protein KY284_028253 [Solanum tuberosum]
MANRTSSKRKSKTKVGSSSKAKDAKTKKKRGRKVAPPILRPTLPMMKDMVVEIKYLLLVIHISVYQLLISYC